jgi:nicotinamidase-related amidase
MPRALLLVDIQRDYFPGGALPLVGPEAAAAAAARVLARFRADGEPVVHLQHVWDAPDATFFRPGTEGVELHPLVAPHEGELVVPKAHPNGFRGTALRDELRSLHVDELVVAGMQTSMCIDATVRAAADLGFTTTVVHDACAAPDLSFGAQTIDGATVHAAFLAALEGTYATLASADELGPPADA